jgi:death-on-curing protein
MRFITLDEAIIFHNMLIDIFGGMHGTRDLGLLNSALNQPHISFEGKPFYADYASIAAVYMFHVVKNHPFIDGNKRTGALLALVFLRYNNCAFQLTLTDLYDLALKVAASDITKDDLIITLKKHII